MSLKIWNEEHRVALREMVGAATDEELNNFDWLMKEAGRLGLPAKNASALSFALERATINTPVFTRAMVALHVLKSRARNEWLDKKRAEKDKKVKAKSSADARQQAFTYDKPNQADKKDVPAKPPAPKGPMKFSSRNVFRGHIVLSTPPNGYSPLMDWTERLGTVKINSTIFPSTIPVVYVKNESGMGGSPIKYVEDKAMEAWAKYRDSDPKTLQVRIQGLTARGEKEKAQALREKLAEVSPPPPPPTQAADTSSKAVRRNGRDLINTLHGHVVLDVAPSGYSWFDDWKERAGVSRSASLDIPNSIPFVYVRKREGGYPRKYVENFAMEAWCKQRDTDPESLKYRISALRGKGKHVLADQLAQKLKALSPLAVSPTTPAKMTAQVKPPATVPVVTSVRTKSPASPSFNRNISVGSVASEMIRSGRLSPEKSFDMVQEMIASGQVTAAEGLELIRECLAKKAQ